MRIKSHDATEEAISILLSFEPDEYEQIRLGNPVSEFAFPIDRAGPDGSSQREAAVFINALGMSLILQAETIRAAAQPPSETGKRWWPKYTFDPAPSPNIAHP